ncbi:response regulator [Plantactinospora solaniradicis]|uniref:Response regulator n=1 Tax=Plantactinospora solaniradicis TaxID=1723736 RepID=A0ABW1K864_9ACTN
MIRVLLVDDQPMVRAGLGLILRSQPDIQVVGECDDGGDAVHAVSECTPDLVCMDVQMPVVDGVEATRRLRAADGPPVCILTTFGDEEVLWSAVDAGAAGFELKSATPRTSSRQSAPSRPAAPGSTAPSSARSSTPTDSRHGRRPATKPSSTRSPTANSTSSA